MFMLASVSGVLLLVFAQADKQADLDAEVIRASVEAFYHKEVWQDNGWQEGDFIAIPPKYAGGRPDFSSELADAVSSFSQGKRALQKSLAKSKGAERQRVESYLSYYSSGLERLSGIRAESADPAPITAVAKLALGRRAVVADIKRSFGRVAGTVTHPSGRKGSVRTIFSIYPPAFSKDGRYACVKGSAPWSIHHADICLFLERKSTGWIVLSVQTQFYV